MQVLSREMNIPCSLDCCLIFTFLPRTLFAAAVQTTIELWQSITIQTGRTQIFFLSKISIRCGALNMNLSSTHWAHIEPAYYTHFAHFVYDLDIKDKRFCSKSSTKPLFDFVLEFVDYSNIIIAVEHVRLPFLRFGFDEPYTTHMQNKSASWK